MLSSNTLGRMFIWNKKDSNGKFYEWWFIDPSSSDNDTDNESDNDTDNECDNDESDE